ncbi:polysaccharide deacetylase family protein [Oceanivirga salmonicida]|uniref:polysaccharide deacetylase family protein n=1 Tax=Oceanivirga salmonicida TaxID=1769291 RepID=UPI00082A2EED|nr:polysaccharide deacetylase family protein [Oceanivirga salmonicida]
MRKTSKLLITLYFFSNIIFSNNFGVIRGTDKVLYYSHEKNKILEKDDILRVRHKKILEELGYDIENVNLDVFLIEDGNIIFGDEKKIIVNIEENKVLFKANSGFPSIYEGEKLTPRKRPINMEKKHIAFTFDDGPLNEYHELIRELFKDEDLATFCVVGRNVKRHKEMLKKTYLEGHEIVNHTYNHPNLTLINSKTRWKEIFETDNEIMKLTGEDAEYLRPPYGVFNKQITKELNGKLALWNVDSLDWRYRNKDLIIAHIKKDLKDKNIVLFHDLFESSYLAVKELIPELKKQGYQFVTYSEMMEIRKNKKVVE